MRSSFGPATSNVNGTVTRSDEPAPSVEGSVTCTVVLSGRSTASSRPPACVIGPTSSWPPAAGMIGEFGQRRNTSSSVGRAGVNCTVTTPSTREPATSTWATTSYVGRFGSGADSGPGSGQPGIGASGLAVVVTAAVVVVVLEAGAADALDEAGASARRE